MAMNQKVIEESVPDRATERAGIQNALSSKIGLKNLLEFLYMLGCEETNSKNSCSFESYTSSNINRKVLSFNESINFAELFLKLMHKNWLSKAGK